MKLGKWVNSLVRVFLFCFLLSSIFVSPVFCADAVRLNEELDFSPGPRLLYPVTDNIKLEGARQLEFKWERPDILKVKYYDFKLYKGYNTVASNVIFSKRISYNECPLKLDISLFEVGQVYAWAVVSIFDTGQKSDKSYSSFKITEK